MVPLYRAVVCSYRLSVVTMPLSAAVWPQFAMQSFCLHRLHVCGNSYLFSVTGSNEINRYESIEVTISIILILNK